MSCPHAKGARCLAENDDRPGVHLASNLLSGLHFVNHCAQSTAKQSERAIARAGAGETPAASERTHRRTWSPAIPPIWPSVGRSTWAGRLRLQISARNAGEHARAEKRHARRHWSYRRGGAVRDGRGRAPSARARSGAVSVVHGGRRQVQVPTLLRPDMLARVCQAAQAGAGVHRQTFSKVSTQVHFPYIWRYGAYL
jgi:hypothetical protein